MFALQGNWADVTGHSSICWIQILLVPDDEAEVLGATGIRLTLSASATLKQIQLSFLKASALRERQHAGSEIMATCHG